MGTTDMTIFGNFFHKNKNLYRIFAAFLIIIAVILLIENAKGKERPHVTYKVACDKSNFWYYDIYIDDKLFIRQTQLPAVSGDILIRDKVTAEKLANKVIYKIKKGEMPSISIVELEEMGVIKGNP